nr:hypothetical protein [Bacillota bacterium]
MAAIGAVQHPVVVIGDVMVDIAIKPHGPVRFASDTDSSIRLGLGGAGANIAVHLARLGIPVRFIGCVGDDGLAQFVRTALKEPGLDAALETIPGVPTGAIAIFVDETGQRTMFPQRGANLHLTPERLLRRWPEHLSALFVSGYALFAEPTRSAARLAMERARAAGVPVAVDPASYANILDVGADQFLEWCRPATILLPNRDEAAVLAQSDSPEKALERLARLFPLVVVKLDRDGARARRGSETVHAPALHVPVVDTTGAGDAFNAGFLAAYLSGAPLAEALAAGNARAAHVVQHVGAS